MWRSLYTRAKGSTRAKDKETLISALDNMTISASAAAARGLPTRHVTIKNRGGLVFASVGYYELMCKIEDRFYSTVGDTFVACRDVCSHIFTIVSQVLMRENFTLANPDVIVNIRSVIMQDVSFVQEFNKMMSNAETAETLWGWLVERISILHGTELAAQVTANLAVLKRKTTSAKYAKRPESRTMNVKFE